MNPCREEIDEGHDFEIPYLDSGRASYRNSKYPRCEICGKRNGTDDPSRFRRTERDFRDQLKIAGPGMKNTIDSEFTDDDYVCVHCYSAVMQTAPYGECEIRSCRKKSGITQATGHRWTT